MAPDWRSIPQRALIGAVHGYRLLLKPWIGNACRFEPTCSAYALQALQRHGAVRGSALAAGRILRCHPWCAGGIDPVPEAPGRGLFTSLLQPLRPAQARQPRQPAEPPQPGASRPDPSQPAAEPFSPTRNLP